MKHRNLIHGLVLGGALIGGALFIFSDYAEGYDSQYTHPALTLEAVKFYNLNFPANPLSENDRVLLMKGAVDEDIPPRYFNHFYDPVYDEGWAGHNTSKTWAYDSSLQVALSRESLMTGFAGMFNNGLAIDDYSYQRALYDYAVGDRKRAMIAMGHVLHLLEDANVPEHTRGDTHLPWAGTESPYEQTMAKWNPENIRVAEELHRRFKKPILLNNLNNYFDELANYSNRYFFSQDTINNDRYSKPILTVAKKFIVNGKERLFIMGTDKNGGEFKLALLGTETTRNLFEIKTSTLISPEIGTMILDDYWSRLSTDFVIHGAGALKLFLDQAEKVKREYANNPAVIKEPGLISGLLGFLGLVGDTQSTATLIFNPDIVSSIINQPNGVTYGDNDVSNTLSPSRTIVTPSPTPFVSSSPSATPLPAMLTVPISPTETPVIISWGVSGGTSNTPSDPTPSPEPIPDLTPSPTPSPTPTPIPSISTTPSHYPSISWEFQPPDAAWINQPAVAPDGTIFFGAPYQYNDGGTPRLYAVGQDGIEKWHIDQEAEPNWPITADDNAVYFGQVYPGFYVDGVNSDSTMRWQFNIGYAIPGLAIDTDNNAIFTASGMVWKLKPDGTIKWSVPLPFSSGFTPVIWPNNDVFVGLFNSLPGFARLSSEDGSVAWQSRANDDGTGDHSMLDPVYDKENAKFYAGTNNGRIVTINPENGEMREEIIVSHSRATTKVTVLKDIFAVGFDFSWLNPASGSRVYGINKADKTISWSFAVDSPVQKQIAVDNNENLYFSTQSGLVYSLDKNGQKLWVIDLGTPNNTTSPVFWNGMIFIGAGGKLLKIND